MSETSVIHLIERDDMDAADEMVRRIACCLSVPRNARHRVVAVRRGRVSAPPIESGIIVSHIRFRWGALPFLVALRAANPSAMLVQSAVAAEEQGGRASFEMRFRGLLVACYALFDRVVVADLPQARRLILRGVVDGGAIEIAAYERPAVQQAA